MNDMRRDRYVADSIATASPQRLLVMLYDRLVLDLVNGERAIVDGDHYAADAALRHAQEIVLELRASLDVSAWSGGPALASLYAWMLTELIGAAIGREAQRVADVRAAVEPLAEAWREAASGSVATAATARVSA